MCLVQPPPPASLHPDKRGGLAVAQCSAVAQSKSGIITVLVPPVKIQASVLLAALASPLLNLFSISGGQTKSWAPPVTVRIYGSQDLVAIN